MLLQEKSEQQKSEQQKVRVVANEELQPSWQKKNKNPKLWWSEAEELVLRYKGVEQPVTLKLCFPWTDPRRYVSLRDKKDREVLFFSEMESLDQESRDALEKAIHEAGFVLEITKLYSVTEDYELRIWKVQLANGSERCFANRLEDWPFTAPDGAFLIRDISGDLYRIEDPNRLDKHSQKQFWTFQD